MNKHSFDARRLGFTQAALSVSRSGAAFTLSHRGAFVISTMTACRPETTRAIRSY